MKLSVFKFGYAIMFSAAVGVACADKGKNESGKGRYSDKTDWTDEYREEHRKDRDHKKRAESRKDYGHEKRGEHRKDWKGDHWNDDRRRSYFYEHGYTRLGIPPGHYPPPGECRIWFPDRPPGQQPPPGGCGLIPPGAWVIHHPYERPHHVHVRVYEPDFPGRVYVTGEFDIGTGAFVRAILGDW